MSLPNQVISSFLGSQRRGYEIANSLRFNDLDLNYLNRTPSVAGNRQTWTWSSWIKKCDNSGSPGTPAIFRVGVNSSLTILYFTTDGHLIFGSVDEGGSAYIHNSATAAKFRDSTAWYHICVALDTTNATSTERIKIYVNGVLQTLVGGQTVGGGSGVGSNTIYPPQNRSLFWNNNVFHNIGRTNYFNGYMAEINFIDGQSLNPFEFGEIDNLTKVWRPKKYLGTYGTNGFYLPFNDKSSAIALGSDQSGNSNNWTVNNFGGIDPNSGTIGTNDILEDSPTNNYCTISNLSVGSAAVVNGNLEWRTNAGSGRRGTFGISSGKWYWENILTVGTNPQYVIYGIQAEEGSLTGYSGNVTIPSGFGYFGFGGKITGTTNTAYGNSFTINDIISVAYDADAGKIWFAKNGVWQASGDPAAGTNEAFSGISGTYFPYISNQTTSNNDHQGFTNFGQHPFTYTPPSGFKKLNTKNLPKPSIRNPDKFMNVVTWTGTGVARSITGIGFTPDLVWKKARSASTFQYLTDSIRGANSQIYINSTIAETTYTNTLTSFDNDGFSLGNNSEINGSGTTYVGWAWKAGLNSSTNNDGTIQSTVSSNPSTGFSIVSWIGPGTGSNTIGHGLQKEPKMIITKTRNASIAYNWNTYHVGLDTTTPEDYFVAMNTTAARILYTSANCWDRTKPTSTVFSVNSNAAAGPVGDAMIAYCFSEIEGYSRIGSYIGNGLADGTFVWCGFRPRWLLIKRVDSGVEDWNLRDSERNPQNVIDDVIYANTSNIEQLNNSVFSLDFVSNGFKCRNAHSSQNASGGRYIFLAFAETPFKHSLAR